MTQKIKKNTLSDKELNQSQTDVLATVLSKLFGADVVPKTYFDKINREKEELLKETKDISKLRIKLLKTECKLQAFVLYHRKWKPTTREFEKKLIKLNSEKLIVDFSNYSVQVSENLKEAYKCYSNGLAISCYVMILRTVEIVVNQIFEQNNLPQYDNNGKKIFVSASQKLNWVKNQKMIGGADYQVAKSFIESRNDVVHEVYVPSEKQILSAFEIVILLTNKLNFFPHQSQKL